MDKISNLSLVVLAGVVMLILSSSSLSTLYAAPSSLLLDSHHAGNTDTDGFLAYAATLSAVISKTSSGKVASDSLRHNSINNTDYWFIYGNAIERRNASYSYSEDSSGVHLGVRAPSPGQWTGLYAESPNSAAHLYHAVISVPFKATPYNRWNTGMYIQTSSPLINYVTCSGEVDSTTGGVHWEIVNATGNKNQVTQFHTLWQDTSNNQPYTRDCTIITNGKNSLEAYLDHKLVYSNNTLDLQMPSPFNAYLEVQSSIATKNLTGTYTDFYVTTNQYVKVTNAPVGGTVKITKPLTNSVFVSSVVDSTGSASLNIGKYHMPVIGIIKIYDSKGSLVASSSGRLSIWGGDSYRA